MTISVDVRWTTLNIVLVLNSLHYARKEMIGRESFWTAKNGTELYGTKQLYLISEQLDSLEIYIKYFRKSRNIKDMLDSNKV